MSVKQAWIHQQVQLCEKALKERGFTCVSVKTKQDILPILEDWIKADDEVYDGGSMSLQEAGVLSYLTQRFPNFKSHNEAGMDRETSDRLSRQAFFGDVFLMSANAITLEGEILNIDGHGNRVSAMIFGPKKVIILAGYNKICKDEEAGKQRIHEYACPMNATRLHKQTPCIMTHTCHDCHSKDRICSSYVKLNYDKEQRIHVILVEEKLGY